MYNEHFTFLSDLLSRLSRYNVEENGTFFTRFQRDLSENKIHGHLTGIGGRLGGYPHDKNKNTFFAAIDIDMKDDLNFQDRLDLAIKFQKNLFQKFGLKTFIERSRGNGIHLWLFFDGSIRSFVLQDILSSTIKKECNHRIADGSIEIFPKGKNSTALSFPFYGAFEKSGDVFYSSKFTEEPRTGIINREGTILESFIADLEPAVKVNTKILSTLDSLADNFTPCFIPSFQYWTQGNRNALINGLAGVHRDYVSLKEEDSIEVFEKVLNLIGDEEKGMRLDCISNTYKAEAVSSCKILQNKDETIKSKEELNVCSSSCQYFNKRPKRDGDDEGDDKSNKFVPLQHAVSILSVKDIISEKSWSGSGAGELWIYNEDKGYWEAGARNYLAHYIENLYFGLEDAQKKTHNIKEIIQSIERRSYRPGGLPKPRPNLIPFSNGVYDLQADKLLPHSPEYGFTSVIPWEYSDEDTDPGYLDQVLKTLVPADRLIDLYELLAYTLWRDYPQAYTFFLVGSGKNGKSVYMNLIRAMIGEENVSDLSIESIISDKFAVGSLENKWANIDSEVVMENMKDSKMLKKLSGRDTIDADRKYMDRSSFYNFAKLIFSCNSLPKSSDTTLAFYRRAMVIEFPYTFKASNVGDIVRQPTQKMMGPLLYRVIQVLKHLYYKKFELSNGGSHVEKMAKYNLISDPIKRFLNQFCVIDNKNTSYIPKSDFRDRLMLWTVQNGMNVQSDKAIGIRLKGDFYLETTRKSFTLESGEDKRVQCWSGVRWAADYEENFPIKEDGVSIVEDIIVNYSQIKGLPQAKIDLAELGELDKKDTRQDIEQTFKNQGYFNNTGVKECKEKIISESEEVQVFMADPEDFSEEPEKQMGEVKIELDPEFKDRLQKQEFAGARLVSAEEAYNQFKDSDAIYFDLETYSSDPENTDGGLDPYINRIRLFIVGDGKTTSIVDWMFEESDEYKTKLAELIGQKYIIGHNLKFDFSTLATKYGDKIFPENCFDTMIGSQLIWYATDPVKPVSRKTKKPHSLQTVVKRFLDLELDKEEQTSDWSNPKLTESQLNYAANDVTILYRLVKVMLPILNKQKTKNSKTDVIGLNHSVAALENRFISVVSRMELVGIPIDVDKIREMMEESERIYKPIEHELLEKYEIKVFSPMSVKAGLKRHGLEVESAKEDSLVDYKDNEIVASVIKCKKAHKMYKLAEGYLKNCKGDRVSGSYQQCEAHSGRMSCREPNVQQIPRDMKPVFYNEKPGRKIIKIDYPAVELRTMAVVTGDQVMIDIFRNGEDPHRANAAKFLGKNQEDITKEERQEAKAIGFGMAFKMGANSLCDYGKATYGVEMTLEQAKKYQENYYKTYPTVEKFHDRISKSLRYSKDIMYIPKEGKYEAGDKPTITVETLLGRKIKVSRLTKAVNVPVQGSAADIMKYAGVLFYDLLEESGIKDTNIINIVHDEVIVECPDEHYAQVKGLLCQAMQTAADEILDHLFETEVDED